MPDPAPPPETTAPPVGTPQTAAQPPAGGAPASPNPLPGLLLPLLLMGVIMYFLMIRPERKQQKERKARLAALKKNDQVLTIGGIYGTIAALADDVVTLKVDEGKDLRIKVARGAIQTVLTQAKGGEDGVKPGG